MQSPAILVAEEPDDDLPSSVWSNSPRTDLIITIPDSAGASTQAGAIKSLKEDNGISPRQKSQRRKSLDTNGVGGRAQVDPELDQEIQDFVEIQMRTMATELSSAKTVPVSNINTHTLALADTVEFMERWILGGAEAWLGYFDEAEWPGNSVFDFLANTILRSVGQVIFCDNPVSGLLIAVAILVDDDASSTVGWGLLNVFVANLFAVLLFAEAEGPEMNTIRHGLFGFNPFLVGQSMVFFSKEALSEDFLFFRFVVLALVLPMVTVIVQMALKNSTFTLPFNIAMWLVLGQAYLSSSFESSLEGEGEATAVTVAASDVNFVNATLRGFGQVFFAGSSLSAGLVLLAVFLYSRWSAAFGIVGSVSGWLWCFVCGVDLGSVEAGLWSYNCVLTGIALGSIFMVPVNFKTIVVYFCGLALTNFSQSILSNQSFVPIGTVPFCLATIVIMAVRDATKKAGVMFVDTNDIGTEPEQLFKIYWARSGASNNPQDGSLHNGLGSRHNYISEMSMGKYQQYKNFLRDMQRRDSMDGGGRGVWRTLTRRAST
ncbi:hypothetical protein TL16_g04177 [Triparma laevis f. inornata]|uniref:Urea transporter n=1 Tax=Triparma laevis f. inornata TaxID=1714386 RepID=A0A9W7A891_9STRA|nr:hypothetical protein TL16_g04177 [Triparma laevis f. inornata]